MMRNWITKGAPIVALMFLVAFGMISCSSDPMSSPDNGSVSYAVGSAHDAPFLTGLDNETIKKGQLTESITGKCWYLIVSDTEAYELELTLTGGIPTETESMDAIIIGSIEHETPPICQRWVVFKVTDIQVY